MLSQPSQFKIQRLLKKTLTGFFFYELFLSPPGAHINFYHLWSPAVGSSQAEPHAVKRHVLLFVLELWWLPKDCEGLNLKFEVLCRESPVFNGGLDWCSSKSQPVRGSGCRWVTHPNLGTGKCSQVLEYEEPQWAWWGRGCAQWEGGMCGTQTRH